MYKLYAKRRCSTSPRYGRRASSAPATPPGSQLGADDLLVLDNYRYLHGRDGYRDDRVLHVLTVRTDEAF